MKTPIKKVVAFQEFHCEFKYWPFFLEISCCLNCLCTKLCSQLKHSAWGTCFYAYFLSFFKFCLKVAINQLNLNHSISSHVPITLLLNVNHKDTISVSSLCVCVCAPFLELSVCLFALLFYSFIYSFGKSLLDVC